jgi:asparagine synthase (glutamine-hydrolysing)
VIAILGKAGPPDRALAGAMLAAAPHRGSVFTFRMLGNAVLGVANRPGAVDATLSVDGRLIAALSGRLDNAAELRRDLTSAGTPPAGPTDADIVVSAFQLHGAEAPNRMRGCFAGVVTDGRTLWCFRDHVGFRPLFYRDDSRAFVAASESRQVAIGAGLPEEPDFDVLVRMFYDHMPADTPAALKGVSRLAQGSMLGHGVGGTTVRRYWHPEELLESARLSPTDVVDRFVQLMEQAAVRSLTGKDAILLSGGLDSPTVAAFAAPAHLERTGRPIGALSAVFPDLPSVDERPYIEMVAERFGIELHTYRPRARALDDVEAWCRLFASPVPILSVPEMADNHELASRLGYDNLLTGDFAEFVFGSPMHLVSHLLTHGRWMALARLLRAERWRGTSNRELVEQLLVTFVPGSVATRYVRWRRLDYPERIPDWLDARKVNQEPYRTDLLPPGHRRWRRAQRGGLAGSTITMEAQEVVGARVGVTIRRPLADVDLWEFFMSLRAETKFPDLRFKNLVRGMMRGRLPDAILDRPRKTLFDAHAMAQVDYPALQRLLAEPRQRIPGVDYGRLAQRIAQQDFNRFDWHWAKDLARIHAFLNAW